MGRPVLGNASSSPTSGWGQFSAPHGSLRQLWGAEHPHFLGAVELRSRLDTGTCPAKGGSRKALGWGGFSINSLEQPPHAKWRLWTTRAGCQVTPTAMWH